MEIEQAIVELQKIAQTLTQAVDRIQAGNSSAAVNPTVITNADITRACFGMKPRHALMLEALMTNPNLSNRKAGNLVGVGETSVRRLRAKWAKQFPGLGNTLADREENLRMQTGRAESQYID